MNQRPQELHLELHDPARREGAVGDPAQAIVLLSVAGDHEERLEVPHVVEHRPELVRELRAEMVGAAPPAILVAAETRRVAQNRLHLAIARDEERRPDLDDRRRLPQHVPDGVGIG